MGSEREVHSGGITRDSMAECEAESPGTHDYYELFLSIQTMIRTVPDNILEFSGLTRNVSSMSIFSNNLGSGGFCTVSRKLSKGRWGRSSMAYKRALPSFDRDGKLDATAMLSEILHELQIYSLPMVRTNPNINTLFGVAFEEDTPGPIPTLFPVLMLEPSPLGNLLDLVSDDLRTHERPYWECCFDVARGLQALHTEKIIHGDVKCENVLIYPAPSTEGRQFIAKLTDLGSSMLMTETTRLTKLRGRTLPFDAPEASEMIAMDNLPFTDVYSLGLLVWRVALEGVDPFDNSDYSMLEAPDYQLVYDHCKIRHEKRTEHLLNRALSTVQGCYLPETANAFCELLSVALLSEPRRRDLGNIIQIFQKHKNHFRGGSRGAVSLLKFSKRNTLKLCDKWQPSPSELQSHNSSKAWTLAPNETMHMLLSQIIRRSRRTNSDVKDSAGLMGLSFYDEVKLILEVDRDFFRPLGKYFQAKKDLTDSIKRLREQEHAAYLEFTDGQEKLLAKLAKLSVRLTDSNVSITKNEILALNEDISRLTRCGELLFKELPDEELELVSRILAFETRGETVNGIFEEPGGLVALDNPWRSDKPLPCSKSTGETTLLNYLDFDTLLSCGIPYKIQTYLFADLSTRIRNTSASSPIYSRYLMEQAICYLLGFGVKPNCEEYLSILAKCYDKSTRSQNCIRRIRAALRKAPGDGESPLDSTPAAEEGCMKSNHDTVLVPGALVSEITDLISKNPSIVNTTNSTGDTGLLFACKGSAVELALFLLNAGANAGIVNPSGETALHWVVGMKASDIKIIVPRLVAAGAPLEAIANTSRELSYIPSGTALHRAISYGNQDMVRALLDSGARVDTKCGPVYFYNGHSVRLDPVELACFYHEPQLLEIMLDWAPNYPVNPAADSEVGLLHFAIQCENKHHRMLRHGTEFHDRLRSTIDVIMRRRSTRLVNIEGLTAVHLAVTNGTLDVMKYLLTSEPFTQDISKLVKGKSPLHCAIVQGDEEKFKLLLEHGADPLQVSIELPSQQAVPVLELAAHTMQKDFYFVKKLLEINTNLSQAEKDGALIVGFTTHQFSLADFLVEKGANIDALAPYPTLNVDVSVLGFILDLPCPKVVEALEHYSRITEKLKVKPNPTAIPRYQQSALHVAAAKPGIFNHHKFSRIYKLLLQLFPSDLEARDLRGYTPLHAAISGRNVVAFRAFRDAGADMNSMTLFEGVPVGPSPKDLLIIQLCSRYALEFINKDWISDARKALEELVNIFRSFEFPAKRSKTMRAELRHKTRDKHQRRILNFIDVFSILLEDLPATYINHPLDQMRRNIKKGAELYTLIDLDEIRMAKSAQWEDLQCLHFINHHGRLLLEELGLADLYSDLESKKPSEVH